MALVHLTERDQFHGENFIRQTVLDKHNLAKGSIAEPLCQFVLINLVLIALRVEKIFNAFKLELLRIKVKQSGPIRWDVCLNRKKYL